MIHIFPTKFVYWEKIENHDNIKDKYIKIISQDLEKNREQIQKNFLWNCKCTSSFFSLDFMEELVNENLLNDIVWNPMDNMLKELGELINLPTPKSSKIKNIWYNDYNSGNWQEVHDHTGQQESTYSGIYILKLNEENQTTFVDSNFIKSWNMKQNFYVFETCHIEEGNVIIFPSELMHYVNPCKDHRISISFNIKSTF